MFPALIAPAQIAADTVVTIQSRDGIALAADVAVLVAAAAVALVALALVPLLWRWRKITVDMHRSYREHLGPVSDRARSIADNVQFITQALRTDVERLNASVQALTARLHQASDHMEERISEFNALMEVVQGEAEDIFLDTAATVRGVREGARSMGRPRPSRDELDDDLDDEEPPRSDGDGDLPAPPRAGDGTALPGGDR